MRIVVIGGRDRLRQQLTENLRELIRKRKLINRVEEFDPLEAPAEYADSSRAHPALLVDGRLICAGSAPAVHELERRIFGK